MTNVFIIHGIGGNSKENWFQWLKNALEKLGCKVFVPDFPTPRNQSLFTWMRVFKDYELYLDNGSIVVGHSLGSAFLLNVLEIINHPIKAAFFVAGFTGLLNNPEFDDLNKTFTDKTFNWAKIKKNCKRFYVINSDNDPYVPLNKGETLAKNLSTELIIIKNAGHINQESGYTEFNFLLEKIKNEL